MKRSMRKIVRRLSSRRAAGLVEYALVLALVAVTSIMVLRGLGRRTNRVLRSVNGNLR